MTHVEVSGAAVTRFSRRDIGAFTRKVLLALEHNGSLREPISEVKTWFQCGIGFQRFHDIKVGDVIEVFAMERVAVTA